MENIIHVPIGGYDTGRLPNVQQYDQNSRVFVCKLWKAPTEMYVQPEPYVIAEGGFVGVVFKWRGAEPSDEYETELVDPSTIKFIVPGAATQRKGEIEMQLVIHENGGVLHGPKMMFNASESLKRGDRVTEPMLILEALNKMTREAAEEAKNAAERVEQMQIDASGLAGDSNKLGGKPPEYYLPVQNLFINPELAIAQAGYNGLYGGELYAADGWHSDSGITVSKTKDGFTLANTGSYWHRVKQKLCVKTGETYTFAVRCKTLNKFVLSVIDNNNTVIDQKEFDGDGNYNNYVLTFSANTEAITCRLAPDNRFSGSPLEGQWFALYPGIYTADTLPPFMPRPYIEELYNCGLVHNGDYPGVNLKSIFTTAADLHAAVAAGDFSKIHVGDYWPITLNGTIYDYASGKEKTLNNAIINMEVADVNFYRNYGDTPVPNHLLFCSRDLLPWALMFRSENTTWYDTAATNPWLGSHLYQTLNNPSNGLLPLVAATDIGAYIYAGPNGNGMRFFGETKGPAATTATGCAWADRGKLFLPSEREVWGGDTWSEHGYGGGLALQWPIFAGTMRHIIKGLGNGGGHCYWWCCSSFAGGSGGICCVATSGYPNYYSATHTWVGAPVCFLFV